MKSSFLKFLAILAALLLAAYLIFRIAPGRKRPDGRAAGVKLYWFIPDGMRADPELFNIYKWAEEGKLPNIKKMMERGSYGYGRPVFPSHTPANFATLFTGSYPVVHGVNDGPMHTEGSPLDRVSVGGFSSAAKKVEPIWSTLESQAGMKVALLSVPGSTPPELKKGVTIRGRWGGWGADFHAVNFTDREDPAAPQIQSRNARLFFFGPPLSQFAGSGPAAGWEGAPASHSSPLEASLSAWGATVHAYIHDSTDDGKVDYDTVAFSIDKRRLLATLKKGDWSDWLPIALRWKVPQKGRPAELPELEREVQTQFKIKVIKLEENGFFRVRFFFNNLNKHLAEPAEAAAELIAGAGPMVDFADNFPPQLIYYPEDRQAFLEEAALSLDWHQRAASFILESYRPQIFINDTYTPNQMLTSRWWMGAIDPSSRRYPETAEAERQKLWEEVLGMYRKLDEIAGRLLEKADDQTVVVLTSDHGAIPLDRSVRLNNLLASAGLLKFHADPKSGEPAIEWESTQAVYLQMHSIYLDPQGLGGNWRRASGPEYEALRAKVKRLLLDLEDEAGVRPVVQAVEREQVEKEFQLLPERAGDLILASRAGYGWSEEITADLSVFGTPLESGYKQAVLSGEVKGLWVPFIILGPGVKKGHYLGDQPFELLHQYPTILHLLGVKPPPFVQGRVLKEVLE
ncbi:MAG: alkaline phosphatase family protein [Planctomycetes bacterium]|nr:alkaline phosphatase family protein [Planctomycetota bacterium]